MRCVCLPDSKDKLTFPTRIPSLQCKWKKYLSKNLKYNLCSRQIYNVIIINGLKIYSRKWKMSHGFALCGSVFGFQYSPKSQLSNVLPIILYHWKENIFGIDKESNCLKGLLYLIIEFYWKVSVFLDTFKNMFKSIKYWLYCLNFETHKCVYRHNVRINLNEIFWGVFPMKYTVSETYLLSLPTENELLAPHPHSLSLRNMT